MSEELLDAYAEGVEVIARADVGAVGSVPAEAVQDVIVGYVMTRPLLSAMRMLAQREMLRTASAGTSADAGSDENPDAPDAP